MELAIRQKWTTACGDEVEILEQNRLGFKVCGTYDDARPYYVNGQGVCHQNNMWSLDRLVEEVIVVSPGPIVMHEPVEHLGATACLRMETPGYEPLAKVLHRAFDQAAKGKGHERHANGEPFDKQVMQDGARRFGVGALLFQAYKKSEESQRLPLDRGVNELLGAIVYLAGAVIRREADGV